MGAVDRFAEGECQQGVRLFELRTFDDLTQVDGFPLSIRHFDADISLSGYAVDADRFRFQGEAKVIDKACHANILRLRRA